MPQMIPFIVSTDCFSVEIVDDDLIEDDEVFRVIAMPLTPTRSSTFMELRITIIDSDFISKMHRN